jgi:hypothetical protein
MSAFDCCSVMLHRLSGDRCVVCVVGRRHRLDRIGSAWSPAGLERLTKTTTYLWTTQPQRFHKNAAAAGDQPTSKHDGDAQEADNGDHAATP